MAKKQTIRGVADSEPTPTQNSSQLDFITAMNWYSYEKDEKDAAKYLKTTPTIARDFLTLAWITRMVSRGFVIPPNSVDTVNEMQARFILTTVDSTPVVKDDSNVVSIQDRVKAKADEIIGEMEGLIDAYGIRGDHKLLNVYQWLQDNKVKPTYASAIIDYFRERSKEATLALSGKNPLVNEYYEDWTKKRLTNLVQAYTNIIKGAERLASDVSITRKPRKKKPVSLEKMVSKIRYLKKDDNLKLQSVDPMKIIGATQLWVFNTKTRKLGVYNAIAGGLKVKVSTLLNYHEDESISKTLRKPEKTIPIVVDGGKIALRKVLDDVNSKSTKMNGRINKDTLLLRVV